MTDDLIERLRALSRHEHSDYSIGDEAAAALEAAREDAERYRWLRTRREVAWTSGGIGEYAPPDGNFRRYSDHEKPERRDALIDAARKEARNG